MSLSEIESLVKQYADRRARVTERLRQYEAGVAALKKEHLPGIKQAAVSASEKETELRAAIEASPALFEQPRSLTMHGIKFGFQKQKGSIRYEDEDKVISLVRKYLPEQADSLIKSEERLLKTALSNLTAAELKKLGVEVKESGDAVLVKSVDSDIDKLVNALLAEIDGRKEN
ncbi:MAG: host-nuclease inhibitor Gam family protein [Elusimicrobiales bacterium]